MMSKKSNVERNRFFECYHETRSVLLDKSHEDKQDWFDFYVEQMYSSYLNGLSKNAQILDLGCNKGYLLKTLSNRGFQQLTGVDLSQGDMALAKILVPEASFFEEDFYVFLKTTRKKYDLIISLLSLNIVNNNFVILLYNLNKSL